MKTRRTLVLPRHGPDEPRPTRRRFLIQASAAAGAACLPSVSLAQSRLETVRLSDRMLVVHGPNANALMADSRDGVILVDGGSPDWSRGLLAAADEHFASKPVRALFNTHWHPEQTGSNLALGEHGVEIVAHENTKLWLGTDVWVRWSDKTYPALPKAALPTTTFYDARSIEMADRKIECGYMLNAHTDGDIWLLFPDENVLVAGGLLSNDGWPVIDWWTGGWIGGMLDGFDTLLDLANENTRIVPANGPVMSLADLRTQHQMYLTIFDRIHGLLRDAKDTAEVLAARPTAEFDAQWGDPAQFVTLAFHSMWGHLRDAYDERMRNIP